MTVKELHEFLEKLILEDQLGDIDVFVERDNKLFTREITSVVIEHNGVSGVFVVIQ